MITPQEIEDKKFGKGIRGYREEDVDQFLDIIIADLKSIMMEKDALEVRVKELEEELENKKATESAVYDALEKANSIANDISVGVEKRSALIIENAKDEAEAIARKSQLESEGYAKKIAAIKDRFDNLRAGYKEMLEKELAKYDSLEKELFAGIDAEVAEEAPKEEIQEAPQQEDVPAEETPVEEAPAEEAPAKEEGSSVIEINDIEQLIQE